MVSPIFADLVASLDFTRFSDPQWDSPEMKTLIRMSIAGLIVMVGSYWLASKIVAGQKGGLLRAIGCLLTIFPCCIVYAFVLIAVGYFSQNLAIIVASIVLIILMCSAAGAIHRIGFWMGALFIIVAQAIAAGVSYIAEGFVTTPEDKAAVIRLAETVQEAEPKDVKQRTTFAMTEVDAQNAAISKYPALAFAGEPLNVMFLERVKQSRVRRPELFQSPDWSLKIADEVAGELNIKPK